MVDTDIIRVLDDGNAINFLIATDTGNATNSGDDISYILRRESENIYLQSKNINVFPCSRRGRLEDDTTGIVVQQYDPEARLNTERTNRLHTAVNGFTDSFIDDYIKDKVTVLDEDDDGKLIEGTEHEVDRNIGTLIFSLAGYYVEAKNFDPATIATALGLTPTAGDKIYAYLYLTTGVSVGVTGYFTELLGRQSDLTSGINTNYLDVPYTGSYTDSSGKERSVNDYFFTGVSFVSARPDSIAENKHYLPLFSYSDSTWKLEQASLLPKIEHDDTEDSIKVSGDFTIEYPASVDGEGQPVAAKTALEVTKNNATINVPTNITGNTNITGSTVITGNTSINGKVAITSVTDIASNTNVAGDFTVKHGAGEDESVSFKVEESGITLNRSTTVNNDLTVSHNIAQELEGGDTQTVTQTSFEVTENKATINVATDIVGNTDITGITNITGNTSVTGDLLVKYGESESFKVASDKANINVPTTIVGDFEVQHTTEDPDNNQSSFKVTKEKVLLGATEMSELTTGKLIVADDSAPKFSVADAGGDNWSAEFNVPVNISNGALTVSEGDTALQKLSAGATELDSLTVNTKVLTVDEGVTIVGETQITGEAQITGETQITGNLAVTDGNSTSTPTLKVDTITNNSNTTTAIEVQKPLNITSTEQTNIAGPVVVDNILTAEQDLIAKRDISAGGSATIAGNLTVGTDDNADTGTITAKKLVEAPTLEASAGLSVQSGNTDSPAQANIDKANIANADITNTLNIHNATNTAKITADEAEITTLSSTTATAETVNSDDLNQKVNGSYYNVPVVFVQQLNSADSTEYQLQIVRANVLEYTTAGDTAGEGAGDTTSD